MSIVSEGSYFLIKAFEPPLLIFVCTEMYPFSVSGYRVISGQLRTE